MKLIWEAVEIDNFKSFRGGHEFSISDFGPGVHFIRGRNELEPRLGPNGAGKSSIWDAVCWCLFGKTIDGSRAPDLKPWHSNKQMQVAVFFKIDRKQHVVRRSAGPNFLDLDGNQVGQEHVDHLIGLDFDTFTHTILLGQGKPLFFDLAPRDKMSLFSTVLDLDRWEARSKAATSRYQGLQSDYSVLIGSIQVLEASIEDFKGMRDAVKDKATTWRLEWGDKMRTVYEEKEELERRLKSVEDQIAELDPQCDWAMTQHNLVVEDLRKAEAVEREERKEYVSTVAEYDALKKERDHLQKAYKEKAARCPTCGQAIEDKTKLLANLTKVNGSLKNLADAKARTAAELSIAEKEANRLRERKKELADEYREVSTKLAPIEATKSDLRSQIMAKKSVLDEGEDATNPYHEQLGEIRRRIKEVTQELKEAKDTSSKLNRRIERARFWVQGFKDIRLLVIEDVLQELEIVTNSALDDVGLVGWQVSYDIEKELKSGKTKREMNVMITNPQINKPVRWESWSGGESQRLRIVGALALSEVLLNYAGVETDLEILDEQAHFMAPEGVRDTTDYLAWRADQLGKKTFYIDHLAVESSNFSSVTTITKNKDGSHIA